MQVLSSGGLALLAVAVWSLAYWNDQARAERHRRTERLAQVSTAGPRVDRIQP